MVSQGTFRRDVLDRAAAKISLPSLYERRRDIGELSQAFALEAARDLGVAADQFFGLTRRALADVETAVVKSSEISVRRLREIVRDTVFTAAADGLPEALESADVLAILERELLFRTEQREQVDMEELAAEFDLAVSRTMLHDLAGRHNISKRALTSLVRAVHSVIDEMTDQPRTYRNVVERTNRVSKVALWLVSGAQSQAEFRRFFGRLERDMPTKSVAHQIFYEVFPKDNAPKCELPNDDEVFDA
jgi:transcriptional regulator with AAA-type ATPase domain